MEGTRKQDGRSLITRFDAFDQINTRVLLMHLSESLGRSATLDDIPNSDLEVYPTHSMPATWNVRLGNAATSCPCRNSDRNAVIRSQPF